MPETLNIILAIYAGIIMKNFSKNYALQNVHDFVTSEFFAATFSRGNICQNPKYLKNFCVAEYTYRAVSRQKTQETVL